jgi:hypothetical protein
MVASSMPITRAVALCGFVALFSATSLAQSKPASTDTPRLVSLGPSWTSELAGEKGLMPGVSAELAWPVRPSEWVAIEGSYHWKDYQRPAPTLKDPVRRFGGSVAWRFGRRSGNGPFAQIAVGLLRQSGKTGPSHDQSPYTVGLNFWAGPGLGVDVKLGQRMAVRVLAEMMLLPSEPDHHLLAGRYRAGLVYRFPSRK